MPRELGEFCKRYHKAFVKTVGDDVEKVKSKVASAWIQDWKKDLGQKIEDAEEFRERFQDFLDNELCFADRSDVALRDHAMEITIENCAICPGNDMLKQEGSEALCPLVPTGLFAISRIHDKKASLDEVKKPGPVGHCKIKYNLAEKKS